MKALKAHFNRSIGREGGSLYFVAHSHHPWPDVTFEAQQRCSLDGAELLDPKSGKVFGEIIPETQGHIARQLALREAPAIVFAPNTNEFVKRLISCLDPHGTPRILTTESEFHSLTRQIARLEKDRLVHTSTGTNKWVRVPGPFENVGSICWIGAFLLPKHQLAF